MGAGDYQLGIKTESSFNTPVVVDRFWEYNDNPMAITPVSARVEGNPLRVDTRFARSDRFVAYRSHAEGTIDLDVMTKGMGLLLTHALGAVATTGAGPYTHTFTCGTPGDLYTKSFTAQLNYPFRGGTNQTFTYSGGKVLNWSIGNTVDEMLALSLGVWFASYDEDTALASASYPASNSNFAFSHGAVTIGGVSVPVTSISVEGDNGYATDSARRLGNSFSIPVAGNGSATFSVEMDFESLTQWDRVHAETNAGTLAEVEAVWTSGTDSVTVTLPAARFDGIDYGSEYANPMQTLSGVALDNGTDSPVSVVLVNGDSTP